MNISDLKGTKGQTYLCNKGFDLSCSNKSFFFFLFYHYSFSFWFPRGLGFE